MKKLFILLLVVFSIQTTTAYDKRSLIERFTNTSCPPCASINKDWYNSFTANQINSGSVSHVVYNVSWPSSSDPMYVLNKNENDGRTSYYSVNSVPTIVVNGVKSSISYGEVNDDVNAGNAEYSPFNIILTPIYYSSNIMKVHVKVIRDAADETIPENLMLRIALTEKNVNYSSAPGSNGEKEFYSVSRKMLPNEEGTSFDLPVIGDSTEFELEFSPDDNFLSKVNIENTRVVAFIQNNITKELYQSTMTDVSLVSQLEALFFVEEHIGTPPFSVTFNNFSTPTDSTSITSWEWDFNNDGTIDSEEPEPTWIFEDESSYTVTLTVKDGIETFTTVKTDFISVLGNTANILVVNGIDNSDYHDYMTTFYNNSVCFADNNVDVWDLYGDQEFDYVSNEKVKRTHLFAQHIPFPVLSLYDKVIWIGDHHKGDAEVIMGDQIVDYVSQGGNFLLATKSTHEFFNDNLNEYCDVSRFAPNSLASGIEAVDPNLVDLNVSSSNTQIRFVRLADSSNSVPIFKRIGSPNWIAGFTTHKNGNGSFIFVAGLVFMYENESMSQNFDYIIENWLREDPVIGIEEEKQMIINKYNLEQNYPNPFNPSTTIKYSIPGVKKLAKLSNSFNMVTLKVYDILGREIVTLVSEIKQAGNYEVQFDASELTSGIYYYELTSDSFKQVRKMILVK